MSLDFIFWDVQHGVSVFISTPDGTTIVHDLGTGSHAESDSEFSPIRYLVDSKKLTALDWLIVTHPHKDHIDDILSLADLRPRVMGRPDALFEFEDELLENSRREVSGAFSTPCVSQSSGATLAACVVETEEDDGEKTAKQTVVVPGCGAI